MNPCFSPPSRHHRICSSFGRRAFAGTALITLIAAGPTASAQTPLAVVDAVTELRTLDSGRFRAVEALGYHAPGDGAGGLFVWTPEFDGEPDGSIRIRPQGARTGAWIRRIPDGELNVRWFGARGDASTDDTRAVQAAFAEAGRRTVVSRREDGSATYAASAPVVLFPPGEYHVYEQITITEGPIRIQGRGVEGGGASRLRYMGEAFVDLLHIDLRNARSREVKIFDMALFGGPYEQGRARYVVNARHFTRYAQIERCVIREGVGLLRLEGCWYADVNLTTIRNVTPNPDWLTPEQLREVHGPGSAPIYLTGGGSFRFNRVTMHRLALDRDLPVQTHRSIYIRSQATSFTTNCIESVGGWGSHALENAYPDYLLWVSGNVNVAELYMERNRAAKALIKVQGGSTLSTVNQPMLYFVQAPVLFENEGVGDLVVRDGFFYRIRAGKLWEVNEPGFGSTGSSVRFENSLVMGGERFGNRRVGFRYDMAGNPHAQLGVADGTGGRPEPRLHFPSIVSGYDVALGRDENGPFVAVDGGVFRRENGKVVGNKQLNVVDSVETADPGEDRDVAAELPPLRKQYLRFDEDPAERRDRWYRLRVGRGGQPYMTASREQPTEKTGDWILQFRLDSDDRPADLFRNPLLELDGRYIGIGSDVSVHVSNGPPSEGFWVSGDRVQARGPVIEWVCAEDGSPGLWVPAKRMGASE